MKKTVALVTTTRADWSYILPLAQAVKKSRALDLRIIAAGAHFLKDYGDSYKNILQSGFKISQKIIVKGASDTPAQTGKNLGEYTQKMSGILEKSRPDLIMLFGDRMEVLAIALGVIPFGIPLAHVGGGDLTLGAVDEYVRHALTKLSHLHFVNSAASAKVVRQMGEDPGRIYNTGSLATDSIREVEFYDIPYLKKQIPFIGLRNFLLVTVHPQTISRLSVKEQVQCVLSALKASGMPVVFTYPNIDMGNTTIITAVEDFVRHYPSSAVIKNAGTRLYYSLVRYAAAVVGNSSSAIYDTPVLNTPALNIGERQWGRLKASNVADVGFDSVQIVKAIRRVCSENFRRASSGKKIRHFFGNGRAAQKIVRVLERTDYKDLLYKEFKRNG